MDPRHRCESAYSAADSTAAGPGHAMVRAMYALASAKAKPGLSYRFFGSGPITSPGLRKPYREGYAMSFFGPEPHGNARYPEGAEVAREIRSSNEQDWVEQTHHHAQLEPVAKSRYEKGCAVLCRALHVPFVHGLQLKEKENLRADLDSPAASQLEADYFPIIPIGSQ